MKVIHVARKPLVGTVAKTALKHGTGGLNIDRSRLGTKESLDGGAYAQTATPRPNPEEWRFKRGGARSKLPGDDREGAAAGMYQPGNTATGEFTQPSGRWPANLILEHKPGCKKVGTKVVEGHVIRRYEGDAANRAYGFYIVNEDNRGADQKLTEPERQPDTVEDMYECVPDCPCVLLDVQSGASKSGPFAPVDATNWKSKPFDDGKGWNNHSMHGSGQNAPQGYGDKGGASRFFKQVGGEPIVSS